MRTPAATADGRPSALDLSSPIPGSWGLVVLLLVVHGGTALVEWWGGFIGLFEGLFLERDVRFRVAAGGQHRDMVWAGDAWRVWTSVILHGGLVHLLANAVGIYALGRLIEPWIGARRLWAWFWLGGVLASLASWAAGVKLSDGASGGAFALLGAAVVIGAGLRQQMPPEDARVVGPLLWAFVALNLVLSFAIPFIDEIAHLTGLLVGVLLGGAIGQQRTKPLVGVVWFWLLACAVLLALGWGAPGIFRPI